MISFHKPLLNFQRNAENSFHNNKNVTTEGVLQVKSQVYRSQLENKENAVYNLHAILEKALIKKKIRKPTKVSKAAKQKRLESKKKKGELKTGRKKFNQSDF